MNYQEIKNDCKSISNTSYFGEPELNVHKIYF